RKLGIARNDSLLRSVLERYIYDNSLHNNLTSQQELLRSKIMSLAKEGTSMIAWQVKEKDIGSGGEELLKKRIETFRNLAIGAYKNDLYDVHNGLIKILIELDSRQDRHPKAN